MDYEKLGVFYLGREIDPVTFEQLPGPLLYDSSDLTTHAVIVGMTGSGKTGLGIGLIEEAAIDGIPVLAIDPKGDLGNLALTFPGLSAEEFEPWVDAREAERKGVSVSEFAAAEAEKWRAGLAAWDQGPERIRRFREAAEVAIYTPGSSSGRPISVLRSFAAPPPALLLDADLLAERLTTTVTGLLTLLGLTADPLSREQILLASILERAWRERQDVSLEELIRAVQAPPMKRLGVMELETVFPAAERMKLAMALNALVASPTWTAWTQGEALDVANLLYAPDGRPRVAVVTTAHLSEAEREFFMSLLLSELVAFTRAQEGTSSLRALVYIDELFGLLPPVAEPPTKKPLMTLLKQARAFGVGMVLATQNPVDLDYKALTNAGTWFVGRLQTARDKARLIDGLTSAAPGSLRSSELDALLSSLKMRTFLLHNVHAEGPALFETRFVLSYLAGPLSREQVRRLSVDSAAAGAATGAGALPERTPREQVTSGQVMRAPLPGDPLPKAGAGLAAQTAGTSRAAERPFIAPDVPQRFLEPAGAAAGANATYFPLVLAAADVHYSSKSYGVELTRRQSLLAELQGGLLPVDWSAGESAEVDVEDLMAEPSPGLTFEALPDVTLNAKAVKEWGELFNRWLRVEGALTLHRHAGLKLVSEPGESERDFRLRCAQLLREQRDAARDKLRQKYASRLQVLERRRLQREQALERASKTVQHRAVDAFVTIGGTLLDALARKRIPTSTQVGTAVRRASTATQQRGSVAHAEAALEQTLEEVRALNEELERELEALSGDRITADELTLEVVSVKPTARDVVVLYVGILWAPHAIGAGGRWVPVWEGAAPGEPVSSGPSQSGGA